MDNTKLYNPMLARHLGTLRIKYCLTDLVIGYYWGLFRAKNKIYKYTDGSYLIRFEYFIRRMLDI